MFREVEVFWLFFSDCLPTSFPSPMTILITDQVSPNPSVIVVGK